MESIRPFNADPGYTPLVHAGSLVAVHAEERRGNPAHDSFEGGRQAEVLKAAMERLAARGNMYIGEKAEISGNILDEYGRISLDTYEGEFNFPSHVVESDKRYVHTRELGFIWQSGIEKTNGNGHGKSRVVTEGDKERVAYHYYTTHGATSEKEIHAAWQKERSQGLAEGWEMFATALFDKAFGDDFLVMRASVYDDYANGIDTFMMNKKTGEIICAFDELHETRGSSVKEKRAVEKRDSIQQKNREGGTTLKYGLKKKGDTFVRTTVPNVPVLCLSVETEPLKRLMYGYSDRTELSSGERQFLESVIENLISQVTDMEKIVVEEEQRYEDEKKEKMSEREHLEKRGRREDLRKIGELKIEEHILTIPDEGSPIKQHLRGAYASLGYMREMLCKKEAGLIDNEK